MKTSIHLKIIVMSVFFASHFAHASIDWAQPPVGCIEDFVPKPDQIPCLDLTGVSDPATQLPANLTPEQIRFWTIEHKPDLALCRSKEILRREALRPGTYSAWTVELNWMRVSAGTDLDRKMQLVDQAAARVGMPAQILFGALSQESLLAGLGIAPDGSNYSCGIGQINVLEWCHAMKTLPEAEQLRLGWPVGIACSEAVIPTKIVEPFYEIAVRRLNGRPAYLITPAEFSGIRFEDVQSRIPNGTAAEKQQRYQAVMSFVANCSDYELGIYAKANELRRLFDLYVPEGMKRVGQYAPGERFERSCRAPYTSTYHPLHAGWLLADAMYNAGTRQIPLLQHYFRMTSEENASGAAWERIGPLEIIEGLHWGGKYQASDQKLHFRGLDGTAYTQTWFKSCIVQRHIARVMQYVTVPGAEIARSLEVGGCVRDVTPEYRKNSSGVKE